MFRGDERAILRYAAFSTASLTFNSSTFCPHSVFMCFVWIWEQTAIILPENIKLFIFMTEKCSLRGTN